jgi:hypothetical protein
MRRKRPSRPGPFATDRGAARPDSEFVGLREAAALAKLPPEVRAASERLWADVAALSRFLLIKPRAVEGPRKALLP